MKRLIFCFIIFLFLSSITQASFFEFSGIPDDKLNIDLWYNLNSNVVYDVDQINSIAETTIQVPNMILGEVNEILPESLILKAIETYVILGHSNGVLTALFDYGKFRIQAMAGMHSPKYRIPFGEYKEMRVIFNDLFRSKINFQGLVETKPEIPYVYGFLFGLWNQKYNLEVIQDSSEIEKYRKSRFFKFDNKISIYTIADAFNRQQYLAEQMQLRMSSGEAFFLDSLSFLMAQLNLFKRFDFSGSLSPNNDIDKYIVKLKKEGIFLNKKEIYASQVVKLFSRSTFVSFGLLIDFLFNRKRRFSELLRRLGEIKYNLVKICWWPEFSTYFSILGLTLKCSILLNIDREVIKLSYETNSFFGNSVNKLYEFVFDWTLPLVKIFPYLSFLSTRFLLATNFAKGCWGEEELSINFSLLKLGIQHYWGYGTTFRRFVKGNKFSFIDKWENGFKIFLNLKLNF